MKTFFSLSLLLALSFAAQAEVNSYSCNPLNSSTAPVLSIDFVACELTPSANYDICKVEEGKVVIGVNPSQSLLITNNGDMQEISCEEADSQQPEQQEEQQQQQQQQTPNQDPEQDGHYAPRAPRRDGPGHGGSNFRMRGMPQTQAEDSHDIGTTDIQ